MCLHILAIDILDIDVVRVYDARKVVIEVDVGRIPC